MSRSRPGAQRPPALSPERTMGFAYAVFRFSWDLGGFGSKMAPLGPFWIIVRIPGLQWDTESGVSEGFDRLYDREEFRIRAYRATRNFVKSEIAFRHSDQAVSPNFGFQEFRFGVSPDKFGKIMIFHLFFLVFTGFRRLWGLETPKPPRKGPFRAFWLESSEVNFHFLMDLCRIHFRRTFRSIFKLKSSEMFADFFRSSRISLSGHVV